MNDTNRVLCLLSFSMISVASSTAMAITGTPSWKPRESLGMVDYFNQDGGDRSLAYDHHGNPGIAFGDFGDGSLHYARRVDGVGWVDAEIDPNYIANPSLAYDRLVNDRQLATPIPLGRPRAYALPISMARIGT